MSAADPSPLAVVVYPPGFDVEPLLRAAHDRLAARGDLEIGGVLPKSGDRLANGRSAMLLEDVASGVATTISQELGAGADSCILDLDGLTRARQAIVRAIESGVDLVFVGKFAKQEAAGHGVREEIARAVIAGVPTLVVMRETQSAAWTAFAGEDFTALPPDVDAIAAWALAATGRAG
jgi:molybdate transport system ATP-binding protein